MGGRDHVGAGLVDLGVDGECRLVHRQASLDDLAVCVDEQQVGHFDLAEADAERVHPEVVVVLRVAGGDVARHPLVEPELGEETEPGGQPLLAVQALLVDRGEIGQRGELAGEHGDLQR